MLKIVGLATGIIPVLSKMLAAKNSPEQVQHKRELEVFDMFLMPAVPGCTLSKIWILLSRDVYPQNRTIIGRLVRVDLGERIRLWTVACSYGHGAAVQLYTDEEVRRGEYLGNLWDVLGGKDCILPHRSKGV
jgi:hypothetical protein